MNRDPLDYSSADLVSEQNGFRWVMIAVFIGLFVGGIFRSTYSSEQLTEIIRKNLVQLPPEIQLVFKSARISLADGLLPDLALVIDDIKINSSNECWGQPQLDANTLRLPLSLRDLFRGRLNFRNADLDQVDFVFLSPIKKCSPNEQKKSAALAVPSSGAAADRADVDSKATSEDTRSRVGDDSGISLSTSEIALSVRSLSLRLPDSAQTVLIFERSSLVPDGSGNSSFEGSLRLSRDSFLNEATSRALVRAKYFAKPMEVDFTLDGNWREGSYQAQGKYSIATEDLSMNGKVKNFPVTSIFPLLQKYKFIDQEFGVEQIWLSADFGTPDKKDRSRGVVFELKNLQLDGDLGEMEVPNVRLISWFPVRIEPVDMNLRGLRVDAFLSLLKMQKGSDMLGSLGIFNGKVHVSTESDIHLEGEHSGLEFIFSNRGQRKNQVISLMTGKADYVHGKWIFRLDSVRPLDGIFLGQIVVSYEPKQSYLLAELQFDELSLSPDVQKLMTGGGTLGSWSGAFNLVLKDQKMQRMTGEVDVMSALIEGLAVERTKVSLRSRNDVLVVESKSKDLKISEGAIADWLKQFFELPLPSETNQLFFRIEASSADRLKWKLSPVQLAGMQIQSEGSWAEDKAVEGIIRLRSKGPELQWNISGTRDLPEFKKLAQ